MHRGENVSSPDKKTFLKAQRKPLETPVLISKCYTHVTVNKIQKYKICILKMRNNFFGGKKVMSSVMKNYAS